MSSPRERLIEQGLAGGTLSEADVLRARERVAEWAALGADVPVEDLLADRDLLSREGLEDATRGEEIPSRLAGLEVLRLAGGTPERPVLLARQPLGGDCVLAYAMMRRRSEAPAEVDAFLRAADLAKRVSGPLWVPMRDVFSGGGGGGGGGGGWGADGAYAVISDIPDGARLDEVLERDGALPPAQALGIVRTLAEGLLPLEALGVHATLPDPSLVFRSASGRVSLVALEVILAQGPRGTSWGGRADPAETARSAGRLLARLVGPEHVQDPVVRDAIRDLAGGRVEPLRPAPPPASPAQGSLAAEAADLVDSRGRDGAPTRAARSSAPLELPTKHALPRGALAAIAVVAVVAVAAGVALVGGRGDSGGSDRGGGASARDGRGDDEASASGRSGGAAGRAPARTGSESGPTHVDPGWLAYEEALAFRDAQKGDARAVIDRFKAVEERYGGSRAAAEAAARRGEFTRAREAEAGSDAERIAARVEPLLAADDVGGALEEVRRFPSALRDTAAAKRVEALETRALAKAETFFTSRLLLVDSAVESGRDDAALAALSEIRRLGVDHLTKAAERRLADAKERRDALGGRRKDMEPEMVHVAGEALASAAAGDVDRARRILDVADRGPLGDVFRGRLASAREAVERVVQAFTIAAGAARSLGSKPLSLLLREYRATAFPVTVTEAAGDRLSYTRGGVAGTVRLGALDPEVLVRLVLSEGRESNAEATLSCATLYAACGRFAQADALLATARRLGAPDGGAGARPGTTGEFEREAQAVRTWLAAAASREIAAADAILESDREGARKGYGKAAVTAPFLPEPHRRLGEMLLAEKRTEEAHAELRRAQALGGQGADLLHSIAKSSAGRPDADVLEAWRQFLRAAPPDDPRAEAARAEAEKYGSRVLHGATDEKRAAAKGLLDAGKAGEAVTALEEAIATDPGSASAHADLARAAEKAGDMVRAYRAWRTAKALAKSTDEVGKARQQMDRLERLEGERGAEAIVRKSAEDAAARGEASSAADLYRRAIGMSPLDPTARIGLGVALYTLMVRTSTKALLDEATTAFDTAIAIAPDDATAYQARGDLRLYVAQDRGGAIDDETAAIDRRKEFAEAYNTRAIAYYLSLKFEAALADITVVKTLRPLLAMPRLSRAGILEALTRYDEAEDELSGAVECNPTDAEKASIKAAKDRIAQRRKADRR